MTTNRWIPARRLLPLSLAFCLLVCGQGGVRAAATPNLILQINMVYRILVSAGAVPPLQAAIAESDAIDCVNKLPNSDDLSSAQDCLLTSIPGGRTSAQSALFDAIANSRNVLQGAWFTRAIYPGQGATEGSIIIDKDNTGTLTSGSGTSTLIFSKYDDPGGTTYIVFAYRTSAGDRGSGALQSTPDGCLMYGAFHSTSDPTTIGNFLMARC